MIQENSIVCSDAHIALDTMDPESVDMCVFSPPYDNLRDYKGFAFDMHRLGEQIFRVLKEGGVCVMVIQDQTIKGRKSLTSFSTILDWCNNIGYDLFECMIYAKKGKDGGYWNTRFRVDHEYMPIFLKGDKPKFFDKTSIKVPCKYAGKAFGKYHRNREKDGTISVQQKTIITGEKKCPGTIWKFSTSKTRDEVKCQHPATYSDEIPYAFIQVFSQEGDLILDPMVGSGSTCIAAHALGRRYIGIDISAEYCEIARKRMEIWHSNLYFDFRKDFKIDTDL